MASRGPYNLDRTTKLLESHKQFPGGLKTVDSDDALGSFFLRDSENISLSEYGFLERRYGLVDDATFELLVTGLQEGTEEDGFKDRLQGYFEYTLPNGVVETIIFVGGRLYLNGVHIKQLYQYPRDTFAKYGPTIDEAQFKTYVEDTYGITFTTFDSIDRLFDTGRQVEATIINKKMYFFTGVYPIVYEGTGEFYLMPEHIPSFNDLFLAGHNVITSDFERNYNTGYPISNFDPDMTDQTNTVFSDLGYKPLFPYNINPPELLEGDPGKGLHLEVEFRLPDDPIFAIEFTGYDEATPAEDYATTSGEVNYGAGLYLEFFPTVYSRPSGSPDDDRLWIPIPDENLDYTVLDNFSSNITRQSFRFSLNPPDFIGPVIPQIAPFINLERSLNASRFDTFLATNEPYKVTVTDLPVGYNDYLVEFKIRKSGFRKTTTAGNEPIITFFGDNDFVAEKGYLIERVFASENKTTDYLRIRPEALWTCNRVINHFGKLMAYGSLVQPERVFIGAPQIVEYFPFSFTRDFETDTAEPIQRITPFMNILVVISKTFTWGLAGIDGFLGSENLYRSFTISPLYGTIAPNSVRPVRNQLFFLSKEGLVSLQSLYAIDEQYNVKKIDFNIDNILPQDPEAVAIQYDDNYWIHFPNTTNNITLRYDIDKRAWMKDTYFEYNGLTEAGKPQTSSTVFNGVHKYLREADRLILVTNPMQVEGKGNYSVRKLHVDFTVATDLFETPRTLFETSFLNQGTPFHEKKYMEKKFEFTIQNEYHVGKDAVYLDRNMAMPGSTTIYTALDLPLVKNHEYKVNVPDAEIKEYNIRLFDIQGNIVKTINLKDNTPPTPSVFDFLVSGQNVSFRLVNNDTVLNTITYQFNDLEISPFFGAASQITPTEPRLITVQGLPFGLNKLVIRARRIDAAPSLSIRRVIYFQVPDGVYDETGPSLPTVPKSLPPLALSVFSKDNTGDNQPDSFVLNWQDQNINSELFEYSFQNITIPGAVEFKQPPTTDTTAEITGLEAFVGDEFIIRVRARVDGFFSEVAERTVTLELLAGVPNAVSQPITQSFPIAISPITLSVFWTDVDNEAEYQVFWKYARDNISPTLFDNYYSDQRRIINANSSTFVYRTGPMGGVFDQRPLIFHNAVIDFNILPRNQNGPATSVTSRQIVVPKNYNPADFLITPINGESGVRIEIPEAKKQMVTQSGNQFIEVDQVFEDEWEIQYRLKGAQTFPTNNIIFVEAYGSNVIEFTNTMLTAENKPLLDPLEVYEFRLRGRHVVTQPGQAPVLFTSGQFVALPTHDGSNNVGYGATFEATTGTATVPKALAPTINVINHGTDSINFSVTNIDNTVLDLYYLVSTSSGARVTETNFSNILPNTAAGVSTTIARSSLNPDTTYYITAGAKNESLEFSTVEDIDSKAKSQKTEPLPPPPPTTTAQPSFSNITQTETSISFTANNTDAAAATMVVNNNSTQTNLFNATVAGNGSTNVTQTGLTAGTSYNFNINAQVSGRTSSNRSQTISTAAAPPGPIVTATFNSDGGTPTYNQQSGPSPFAVSNPGSPTRTNFTFNGWSPSLGTPITSNTTFVAQWMAITSPEPPAAPTNLTLSNAGGGTLNVGWSHPGTAVQGFFIQWGSGSTTNYSLGSANLSASVRSYQITGLPTGQAAYIRVLAANVDGDSAYLTGSIFLAF